MSSVVSTPKVNKMPAKKSTPVATPVPAETATPAPAKRTRAAPKAEVVVPTTVDTPVPAAPVEAVAPAETRTATVILTDLQDHIRALNTEFSTRVRALVSEAQEAVKALKRDARDSKRRRRVDPATLSPEERKAWEARRANNAFLKLRPISDELATFMGLPAKSQKSQTEVTKFISTYVKTHNCFDPNFKRRIIPDAKLAKLLRVKDSDQVTYLNLQSFLKVHFLKATA